MDQLWDILIKMIPGLAGYALGNAGDAENQKNMYTPEKAMAQAKETPLWNNRMLGSMMEGNPRSEANPFGISQNLYDARQTAQTQLAKPVTPPPVYQGQTTQGGNMELLQMLLQKALGGFQNPGIDQGVSNLQGSLNNRFSPRPINNQVTATR